MPVIKKGGLIDFWVRKVRLNAGNDIHFYITMYLKTDVDRYVDVSILTWYLLDCMMDMDVSETEMTVSIRLIAQYLGKYNSC